MHWRGTRHRLPVAGDALQRRRHRDRPLEGQDRDRGAAGLAPARLRHAAGEAITSDKEKAPERLLRGLPIGLAPCPDQLRVRIRIMKLSKPSSATCCQANESLRKADRLSCSFLNIGLLLLCSA